MSELLIRPFESPADYLGMIDYFHGASDDLLARMGVDRGRLPARQDWLERAWRDHERAEEDPQRDRFHVAWMLDGAVVGHSSINQIRRGDSASAHLHLWRADLRRAGIGGDFFRRSVSYYFTHFDLQVLRVEPYAENAAPNRVVEKLGFRFVKRYRTVPGPLNFEQEVNRYEMQRAEWELLREDSGRPPRTEIP
jgi:RimJ/RimL family protein N-acetyltransferase